MSEQLREFTGDPRVPRDLALALDDHVRELQRVLDALDEQQGSTERKTLQLERDAALAGGKHAAGLLPIPHAGYRVKYGKVEDIYKSDNTAWTDYATDGVLPTHCTVTWNTESSGDTNVTGTTYYIKLNEDPDASAGVIVAASDKIAWLPGDREEDVPGTSGASQFDGYVLYAAGGDGDADGDGGARLRIGSFPADIEAIASGSGEWTVPSGCSGRFIVVAVGGGGGGGAGGDSRTSTDSNGDTTSIGGSSGGGGGAGGAVYAVVHADPGTVFDYSIGSGGTGGIYGGADAGDGGMTTFYADGTTNGLRGSGGKAGGLASGYPGLGGAGGIGTVNPAVPLAPSWVKDIHSIEGQRGPHGDFGSTIGSDAAAAGRYLDDGGSLTTFGSNEAMGPWGEGAGGKGGNGEDGGASADDGSAGEAGAIIIIY